MASTRPKRKTEIPHRNRSPYGRWIASYIEVAVWGDDPTPALNSRCQAWENTIIIKARDREAAYKKATRIGSAYPDAGKFWLEPSMRTGRWVYIGLTSLLPIYEELGDGTEILWTERDNLTRKTILAMVKTKHELSVFDDTPGIGDVRAGGEPKARPKARKSARPKSAGR